MPIVKQISIRKSVIDFLRYIIDAHKTENGLLVHGIGCAEDAYNAYKDFRRTYEHSTGRKFKNYDIEREQGKNKGSVLMHHYIQSFSPDENITPEKANELGREWARKAFGDDFQILVTTHVDKGHIHNHIAVCPYSLKGKKWNSNLKTLNKLRKLSDEIAKQHGLSVIENPKTKNHMKYKEWKSRKKGVSWKANLCEQIDKIILEDNVKSVDDLAKKLREMGCEVRLGKYMTVKLPDMKRGIRTENLDKQYGGYSMRELEYRIAHKDKEISFEAISKLHGEQRAYAIYMRSMQISVFQRQERKHTYYDLLNAADLLTYTVRNNINSVSDFEKCAENRRQEFYKILNREREINRELEKIPETDVRSREILQKELEEISEKKISAQAQLRESEKMFEQYKKDFGLAGYEAAQREYEMLRGLSVETEETAERDIEPDGYGHSDNRWENCL